MMKFSVRPPALFRIGTKQAGQGQAIGLFNILQHSTRRQFTGKGGRETAERAVSTLTVAVTWDTITSSD